MKRITRGTFIERCANMSALAMIYPYHTHLTAWSGESTPKNNLVDNELLQRMVDANDNQVSRLMKSLGDQRNRNPRRLGHQFAMMSASYCHPGSIHHQCPEVSGHLERIANHLLELQRPDGTLNAGNLESPPDTAFVLDPLCAGLSLLLPNKSADIHKTKADIRKFILQAGEALSVGGVHTPNHRWVLCAALARINALYPDQKYIDSINDWLGEGIFIDSEGHFPERSRNYSEVENKSLITMGRLLKMPGLLEPVRKNLEMTYYYMEPNGDLVTNDSRRQDQYSSKSILSYYLHYRYMANLDNNGDFAAIARFIETLEGFEEEVLTHALFYFMEEPLLQKRMPDGHLLPDNYEKLFVTSKLLRIRRGDTTMTFFGGVDWPLIIASGRSNSPDFFAFRKGEAILRYMRLSSRFFNMGYFYSGGLMKDGERYILHKKLEVPYYQPLPVEYRNARGDYELSQSIDGRFWNKMSFEKRPVSNVKTLETTVTLREINGSAEVNFEVMGQEDVMVTIELCFREGGELSGVTLSDTQTDIHFLEQGMGQYRYGKDTIHFGPGTMAHKYTNRLEGERYSTHHGTLRTEGQRVYLTGMTPFVHKITFG
jgi:hypothetical protein